MARTDVFSVSAGMALVVFCVLAYFALTGYIAMLIWNGLFGSLLHWQLITYFQGVLMSLLVAVVIGAISAMLGALNKG